MTDPNVHGSPLPGGPPPVPQPGQMVLPPGGWVGGAPVTAPAWTAAPPPPAVAPGLFSRLDPRGWRTTILAAVIMVGVVGGVNLLNAAVPLPAAAAGPAGPQQPGAEQPGPVTAGEALTVRDGVTCFGPSGWSIVESQQGSLVLARGAAVIGVEAQPFSGSPASLEAAYREQALSSGVQTSEPKQVTFGNQIPGLLVVFTVQGRSGPVDGVYIAGVRDGMGVVVSLVTPQGDLGTYGDDADVVVNSVRIGG